MSPVTVKSASNSKPVKKVAHISPPTKASHQSRVRASKSNNAPSRTAISTAGPSRTNTASFSAEHKASGGSTVSQKPVQHLNVNRKRVEQTYSKKGESLSVSPLRNCKEPTSNKHRDVSLTNATTAATSKATNFQDLMKLAAQNSDVSKNRVKEDSVRPATMLAKPRAAKREAKTATVSMSSRDHSPLGKALIEQLNQRSRDNSTHTITASKLLWEGRGYSEVGGQNTVRVERKGQEAAKLNIESELLRRPLRKAQQSPLLGNKKGICVLCVYVYV